MLDTNIWNFAIKEMSAKNIRLINRIVNKQSFSFIARKEGMTIEEVKKFAIKHAPIIIKRMLIYD